MKRHAPALALALALAIGVSASAPPPAAGSRFAPASVASASAAGGCVANPPACGFPDAANAGVPGAMALLSVPDQIASGPGWYYDPRGWVEVTGDGTVLSGLSMTCNLDVSASDVTIKDVRVVASGQSSFGISLRHTANVTIENSTITGVNTGSGRLMVGIKDIYGDSTGLQVLRNNIIRTGTGIQVAEGLLDGNYIHNMGYLAGDHINGVTVSGGTEPLIIQDNTILIDRAQTDAISLFQDTGVEANKVIEDNLLAGGGYTIYGGQEAGQAMSSGIVIINNRISTMYYPNGGFYGPAAYFSASGPGNAWFGNLWDDTEQLISMP